MTLLAAARGGSRRLPQTSAHPTLALATSLAVSPNALNPPGAIARLNPDGTLDNTFGTGGVMYTSTAGVLAVQSDGHILLLGDTPNTVSEGLDSFLPNGQIDTAFGAGGQALPAPPITVPQFEELKEELKVTLYRSADYDALSGQNASQRGC